MSDVSIVAFRFVILSRNRRIQAKLGYTRFGFEMVWLAVRSRRDIAR